MIKNRPENIEAEMYREMREQEEERQRKHSILFTRKQ
jgi:hypothetical protein